MRLRALILAAVFIALALPARAQVCPGVTGNSAKAYAGETLTVSSTALPFTASKYNAGGKIPDFAQVTLETAAIRYWTNSLTPTATVGMLLTNPQSFTVCGQGDIQAWLAIRTAADASITVQYFSKQ